MAAKSKIEILIEAKVKEAINNLNKAEDEIDKMGKTGQEAGMSFSQLGTAVKGFISALAIREVAQFSVEVSKLYGNAVSLRRSLANLAAKEGTDIVQLMNDLRKATAGTVSDLELMRNATQAKFLGIDLKNLPVLLEFARRRAKDTGQDVNYLVESIVTGIGRKSPLILDNLGLKMSQLREAVKEVAIAQGDWNGKVDQNLMDLHLQEAAVLIAKKAIKASGEEIHTAADELDQFNTQWENLKIILGAILSGPLIEIVKVFNGIFKSLGFDLDLIIAKGLDKNIVLTNKDIKQTREELKEINEELNRLKEGKTAYIGDILPFGLGTDSKKRKQELEQRRKTLQEDLKIYEDHLKELEKLKKENEDKGSGGDNKTIQAEIERAKKEAEFLKQLRIANIEDEYERKIALINAEYEKEKALYKDNNAILIELAKLRDRKIKEVEEARLKKLKEARAKEIALEAETQKKIEEIRTNTIALSIKDEYQRRLFLIEAYYKREIELAKGNAELIAALENEKQAKIKALLDETAKQQAEQMVNSNILLQSLASAGDTIYNSFIDSIISGNERGKENSEQIFKDIERAFIGTLANMLRQFVMNKIKEALIEETTEAKKTAALATGAATRNAISATEVATSNAKTAANTSEAASEFFAAHAGIPFVGYAIAAAFVAAMMAMLAGIGKKASGGLVRREDLSRAFIPSGEDGLLGVQENEYVIRRDRVTPETLPILDAINYGPNLRLSRLPGPPQPVAFSSGGYQKIIEREIPVSGQITVKTIAPEMAQVVEHYIGVNRTILYPDTKYIKQNLETEDNPFS